VPKCTCPRWYSCVYQSTYWLFSVNAAAVANSLILAPLPGNAPKDSGGNFISPYAGTLTIGSNTLSLQLSCDDFTHNISTGVAYTAVTVSTLTSNFGNTLFGSLLSSSAATALYEQVFYLSSLEGAQIALNTPSSLTTAGVIQDAIWTLTNPYEPNNPTHSDPPSAGTATYISDAAANYQKYDYSKFVIVDAGGSGGGGIQELFYSTGPLTTSVPTPEPGTIALLAGGFGALGFYRRRTSKP
jgi:PEP-CTERM motif